MGNRRAFLAGQTRLLTVQRHDSLLQAPPNPRPTKSDDFSNASPSAHLYRRGKVDAAPIKGPTPTIQQTLVRRDDRALRELHVVQPWPALDGQVAGDVVRQATAVRARIARDAVVLEGGPLVGVKTGREVGGGGRGLVRAVWELLVVRC